MVLMLFEAHLFFYIHDIAILPKNQVPLYAALCLARCSPSPFTFLSPMQPTTSSSLPISFPPPPSTHFPSLSIRLRHSSGARSLLRAPAPHLYSLLFTLYSLLVFISPYSSISAILLHACPSPHGFAACDIFSYSARLSRSFVNSL